MRGFCNPIIAVIGCGGTGSYLVDHMGRLFSSNRGLLSWIYHQALVLVDADTVSDTNIVRQNFNFRDLRKQKGLVLQQKLLDLYGVPKVDFWATYATVRVLKRLTEIADTDPLIIVSCVDNHESRNLMLTQLKPNPDSFDGCRQSNWLYLDSGGSVNEGWVSALGVYNNVSFGVDMRTRDAKLRNNTGFKAPTLDSNGREYIGCGSPTISPQAFFSNQQNAYLLASQLNSILSFGKGYGLIGYKRPDFDTEDWISHSYQTNFLEPFAL